MIRILGIDPGSRTTGYGVLDSDGFRHSYIGSGFLKLDGETHPERLGSLFQGLAEVIEAWKPQAFAIEQAFVKRNADSALKLGQARGAAICAGVQAGLAVAEYTPRTIKKAIVGSGAAEKQQVQIMICHLLTLEHTLQGDEADALAVAVCHANHMHVRHSGVASGSRRGRWV